MGRPTHAARSRALSAPSTAVACGRPRRGAVAALVPRWSHGDDHLPGGRVTRALPPPAKGHGRGAWCKRRNRTAGGHGGRTYPANQHRVCIHTLSCVRRLTMLVPIGTAFGYGTRTHTLSRTLPGREASRCAVRPQSAAQKRATDATRGRLARSRWPSRPLAEVDSTARGGRFDPCNGRVDLPGVASRRVSRGDSTPHARSSGRTGGRLAHPTRPSPFGESPSAAVDSPPRVGPRRGRVDRSPLPCAPPLPLRALPSCCSELPAGDENADAPDGSRR